MAAKYPLVLISDVAEWEQDISPECDRRRNRIVFLYSRIPPYLTGILAALMDSGSVAGIDIVHWDQGDRRGNLYVPQTVPGVNYISRSEVSDDDIISILKEVSPQILYISGWMDRGYLRAVRKYRRNSRPYVVAGIDDQWTGSIRQRLGSIYYKMFLRNLIDVMWVAGGPQRIFAHKFGHDSSSIIGNLLSGGYNGLNNAHPKLSKRFLFVGRFDPVKGLDTLIDAYLSLPSNVRADWSLDLVGDGPLREALLKSKLAAGIKIYPYLQPHELSKIVADGGIGCFPSTHEQWGVAIHELAAAGYPLVLSDACGAASEFLIEGYNGYRCRAGSAPSLRRAMLKVATLSEGDLRRFAARSQVLAARITPEISAASLLSLLEHPRL